MLGLLAPTALYANGTNLWKPQADFSKSIKAGTFVITNSSGKVVRTITTTDARRGSLRNGLNWNGRNDAGTLVPAGTYRWTFTVTAMDGTGAATNITGTAKPTGTVKVTR